jgi:hypothetical protein
MSAPIRLTRAAVALAKQWEALAPNQRERCQREIELAAAAPDRHEPDAAVISLRTTDAARLTVCHDLLARAALDLGIKAEGSSKITRALEDVADARDALWQITSGFPKLAIGSRAIKDALGVVYLDQLAMSAFNSAMVNWQHSRAKHRRDTMRKQPDDEADDA